MSSGRMEDVKLLLVLCLMLKSCYGWANSYDAYLNFNCPVGQQIVTVASIHSDHYEDRKWNFRCENYAPLGDCAWHSNVNQHDKLMNFECPGNGAICGFRATHSDHYEDRVFDVRCCAMTELYPTGLSCKWSGEVNEYDQDMYYGVPWHRYMHGIYSTHSNGAEDRRYQFRECRRWIW